MSKGVFGKTGTRNAPSLLGVANNKAFFWDGRRSHLDEAVLDAFINPVELDLDSIDDVLQRIRANNNYSAAFRRIFPQGANAPNAAQVASVISAFLATLTTGTSDFDRELRNEKLLSPLAEQGKTVFDTVARCSECHSIAGTKPRFTDDAYHFSAIGSSLRATSLASLTQEVISDNLAPSALGPRILTDAGWSSLGRFVVTQSPGDIGFFKTPSLRNVSRTAPYMHDGSIASLEEAMNYEIYYRANGGSGVLTLSLSEREALLAFLESLSDTTTNR